ncbi:WPP domain-interacting protein 2 [Acorus calamus]|uniref:WPP domain-interacting protein 2 n=1 Tax=Acorus calamus TaxID=4465 RepID=A0AAV9F068_ACOCL|nr:WPP domain-interacting protein 2 [Acorus calamus]
MDPGEEQEINGGLVHDPDPPTAEIYTHGEEMVFVAGTTGSPSSVEVSEAKTPTKGLGLRRWRRRARSDPGKDGAFVGDPNRALKRGLPNAVLEPVKVRGGAGAGAGAGDNDTPLSPVEASVASAKDSRDSGSVDGRGVGIPIPDLITFSLGAVDSENSEDRSSVNAHKSRHGSLFGTGASRERSARGARSAVAAKAVQRGKSGSVDSMKKIRGGDRVRFEKENSMSSVESDLRSSYANISNWGGSIGNGKGTERELNFEEGVGGCYKENGVGDGEKENSTGEITHGSDEEEGRESFRSHSDRDPLVESLGSLQAAREALEKEIQNFEEIGKGLELNSRDKFKLANGRCQESNSCGNVFAFGETETASSPPIEVQLIKLSEKVGLLEQELQDATMTVKVKESRVSELEGILNGTQRSEKENMQSLETKIKEIEIEMEMLFQEKIEANLQSLIVTRMIHELQETAESQIALVEEQSSLVEDQAQIMIRLGDSENKAILLTSKAEELEASCRELLGTEELLKLQNQVCKVTMCSFVQIVLLCITFGLFVVHILSPSIGVVPT